MDPMGIAGMIFTLLLTMVIGGVILLLPLARRLGLLIESKIQEKDAARAGITNEAQLKEMIHALEEQVRLLAERQEFTEKLLTSIERPALPNTRDSNT